MSNSNDLLIRYLQPGIGDLTDLEVSLQAVEEGRWQAYSRPGWYFFNKRESYLYVDEGSKAFSINAGLNLCTVITSSLISSASNLPFSPYLYWAPITVESQFVSGGLKADYYKTKVFTNLASSVTEPVVNISWGLSPPGALQASGFSIRYTGIIRPPETGTWSFFVKGASGDQVRLWIQNELIISTSSASSYAYLTSQKDLVRNAYYEIMLEYVHQNAAASAGVVLQWASSSQASSLTAAIYMSPSSALISYYPMPQSFSPMEALTWSPSGNLKYSLIPSGSHLLGMCDQKGRQLASVAGSADILDTKAFYYDEEARRLWVRSVSGVSVDAFANLWFYTRVSSSWSGSPLPSGLLKIVDLVPALSSGSAYARHRAPENVRAVRGYQSVAASASQNLITYALTGVSAGDLIRLEYYVPNTFAVINPTGLLIYAGKSDNILVKYERGLPGTKHLVKDTQGIPYQFNPIFGGARSGYLLGVPSAASSSLWGSQVSLSLYNSALSGINWEQREPFRVVARVTDQTNQPIGRIPLTWNIPAELSLISASSSGQSDDRGEAHLLFTLVSSTFHSGTLTILATAMNADASTVILTKASSDYVNVNHFLAGQLNSYLDPSPKGDGRYRYYAYASYLDGIPYIVDSDITSGYAGVDESQWITLKLASENGGLTEGELEAGSFAFKPGLYKTASILPRRMGIVSFRYVPPEGSDTLRAWFDNKLQWFGLTASVSGQTIPVYNASAVNPGIRAHSQETRRGQS
jgi:hypothetical protein